VDGKRSGLDAKGIKGEREAGFPEEKKERRKGECSRKKKKKRRPVSILKEEKREDTLSFILSGRKEGRVAKNPRKE